MCCPTGYTQWPLLGSHVSNYMSCYSTGLPGAAKGIPMKRKHTVDLPTEKSRHGGSNAKSGCCITNANVRHWSWTLKAFCMHSGARKRMLVLRLMHKWNIAQSGGKQERTLTSSSDDDSCRMWETRLSRSGHDGHLILHMDGMEDYFMVEEMLWGAERGACSFTFFASFHWPVLCVLGLCCFCLFCLLFVGLAGENSCI